MKLFLDLFPVILFFAAYKLYDIYVATATMIVACLVQLGVTWLRHRRVEKSQLWTCIAILIFGGATLILRNPAFIKWKPSIINWALGVAFLVSQFIGEKPLVERMMAKSLELPGALWARLNLAWVGFFIFCGVANLFVVFRYSENTWVNFKLFGLTSFAFLFILGQVFILKDYVKEPDERKEAVVDSGDGTSNGS